jgi:hypothetical protein
MLLNGLGMPWWLTNVYGPTTDDEKDAFLQELRDVRLSMQGPWLICRDFNMIYQACDKNNGCLHFGIMRRIRRALDDHLQDELHLSERLFTWSNHWDSPTLEHLDRAFASMDWLEQYHCHHLRCLSNDCSDHAPLLLVLNFEPWAHPRLCFDDYWAKLDGFLDAVSATWEGHITGLDPCQVLDQKLRAVAKALHSWKATKVADIRL